MQAERIACVGIMGLSPTSRAPALRPSDEQRLQPALRPRNRSPVMYQSWQHVLFLHWPVRPEIIQQSLPAGLHVDTYEDTAFLGVVPFFMRGVRPRWCPAFPGLSNFLELNLRTYVTDDNGNPGVWFYSLDANQSIAVKIARTVFSLPYHYARMDAQIAGDGSVAFTSARKQRMQQVFHYKQLEPLPPSSPGSLEFFLAERYLLFSRSRRSGKLYTGQVHHAPYQLFTAELKEYSAELFALNGFAMPADRPSHVMVSPGVNVEIFALQSTKPRTTETTLK